MNGSISSPNRCDAGGPETITTLTINQGESGTYRIPGGVYYTVDGVICTNGQNATASEIYSSNSNVDASFQISNVTANTVCTVMIGT